MRAHITDLKARVPRRRGGRRGFHVLFTCIGRRVSLLESFREAAGRLGLAAGFLGTDTTALSPALRRCDEGFLTAPTDDPAYAEQLLALVAARDIDLIVPTTDRDLALLATLAPRCRAAGCQVLVSEPVVIAQCQDKRRTARFLSQHGFHAPRTATARQVLAGKARVGWPCYVKPWDGAAGRGHGLARSPHELRWLVRRIPRALCQSYVEGREYTCDVYVDGAGRARCVVPRERLEVRSGEVSKARTVKDRPLMREVASLVETFGAGPGVITVQVMVGASGEHLFIEVNPRFGGGVPLSIRAGARFADWILAERLGRRPRIRFDGFTAGLTMLRYDAEVWAEGAEV